MDDSTSLALEGGQSAVPWAEADVEGRRADATAVDGRHRHTANFGANKSSRPSAVRFIHTPQRVPRSSAVRRDAAGSGEAAESQQRSPGESADDRSRNRRRPANQRTATDRTAIQPPIHDSGAEVEPDL